MTDIPDINEYLAKLITEWKELTREQCNRITLALGESGPEALEPLLKAYEAAQEETLRHALLDAMASLGTHDGRIEEHLLRLLDTDPLLAAMLLSRYADPSLLPQMYDRLGELENGPPGDLTDEAIRELHFALDDLEADRFRDRMSVANDEELRRRHEELERETALLRREIEALGEPFRKGASQQLGRNDPCWCGSGKKYKRCHLKTDQDN